MNLVCMRTFSISKLYKMRILYGIGYVRLSREIPTHNNLLYLQAADRSVHLLLGVVVAVETVVGLGLHGAVIAD